MHDNSIPLLNSLSSTCVDLGNSKREVLFLRGFPIMEAVKQDNEIIGYRLFPAFFHALDDESDGINDNEYLDALPLDLTMPRNKSLIMTMGRPIDDWFADVAKAIERCVTENVFERLRNFTIDALLYEAPQNQTVQREIAEVAQETISMTLAPEDMNTLPLKIGRRTIYLYPFLYDKEKEKFLFLLEYGTVDNSIRLAAFWSDEGENIQCDPRLSSYFNDRPEDLMHPWMKSQSIPLMDVFEYLNECPGVFDTKRANARRNGHPEFIFKEFKQWIDPHIFAKSLLECCAWMRHSPIKLDDGGLSTAFAMGLANKLPRKEMKKSKLIDKIKDDKSPYLIN